MSVGTNAVKATAKTALKGNWLKAIAVCLIAVFSAFIGLYTISLLSSLIGEIAANILSLIFNVCLILPLGLGIIRYIWRMLFSVDDNPICAFYWFSSKDLYVAAMHFIMLIVLRVIFWLVILNIPTLLLFILSKNFVFDILDIAMPLWAANLNYSVNFLFNASVIVTFFIMLKYYMAPLLFVADDEIDAYEALHMSTVISKRSGIDFVYLIFSFLGWLFLSMLVIPLIFTLPYMFTAYAVHVRFAVAEYNRHIEERGKKNFNIFSSIPEYE